MSASTSRPRRWAAGIALAALVLAVAGFVALGTWQLQRLAWKRALIARIDTRVHALPGSAPGPAQWSRVTAAANEYQHVRLDGAWVNDRSTRVQASTEAFGSGYWLLTPLRQTDGSSVLVNRGFIAADACAASAACMPGVAGSVQVVGLLRMSEPRGWFLHRNVPAQERWYSRDVAAIAATRDLPQVAPYFVDADASSTSRVDPHRAPVGGLTVLALPNNHLQYALTWYALALLVLVGAWIAWREQRRDRLTG